MPQPSCIHCNAINPAPLYIHNLDINVCRDCLNRYYRRCPDCLEIFNESDMCYDSANDCLYCEECYNERHNVDTRHPYNFKTEPRFYVADDELSLDEYESKPNEGFGWELETDFADQYERALFNAYMVKLHEKFPDESLIFLKEDGSLSSYGVEIVSHVGSLKFWKQSSTITDICKIAKECKYASHNASSSCGFHIHASRSLFGDSKMEQELTVTKAIMLIDKFWEKVIKLSRRSEKQMLDWCRRYDLDSCQFDEVRMKASHYMVIALTEETYELRMFRGTLKESTLLASLEFYDALIKFCRETPLNEILFCEWNTFREYSEKSSEYLTAYYANKLD